MMLAGNYTGYHTKEAALNRSSLFFYLTWLKLTKST